MVRKAVGQLQRLATNHLQVRPRPLLAIPVAMFPAPRVVGSAFDKSFVT